MIWDLVRFFRPLCEDQSTLNELDFMATDRGQWQHAYDLFQRIRQKTLHVEYASVLYCQYNFEEICAKTLFNVSNPPPSAPFDCDSAFWVLPTAIAFARRAGIYKEFWESRAISRIDEIVLPNIRDLG